MKRQVMFIVLPIILVLALLASPVLAKDPGSPGKGLLWETISSLARQVNEGLEGLQGQIDGIQAYLANFTEEDPVFSAMDTEADLEAQIGNKNVLTEGENITLLNNDAEYITKGNVVCDNRQEPATIAASVPGVYYSRFVSCGEWVELLTQGETILSVGGHVTYMWEGNPKELAPYYYDIFTNISYGTNYALAEYFVDIRNPFAYEKTFTVELYCVYLD